MEVDNIEILRIADGRRSSRSDPVVHETEVTIRLDGRRYRRLCCLSTDLEELALGHFLAEGIAAPSDININVKGDDILVYRVAAAKKPRARKNTSKVAITEQQVSERVDKLNDSCPLFRETGGTHVVGIFHGNRSFFIEDISRHCAIDKVIGRALKEGIDLSGSVLVTSCRQTLSTISKAVNAQIPIVITIAAPTSLAIEKASRSGVTLVGFARDRQFNIYANDWRIVRGAL